MQLEPQRKPEPRADPAAGDSLLIPVAGTTEPRRHRRSRGPATPLQRRSETRSLRRRMLMRLLVVVLGVLLLLAFLQLVALPLLDGGSHLFGR